MKMKKLLSLLLSSLILLSGCTEVSPSQANPSEGVSPIQIKSCGESEVADDYPTLRRYILELRPDLRNEGDEEVIEHTVRSLIYSEFSFGNNYEAPLMEGSVGFRVMIEDKTLSYKCWGTTFLFRQALHSFGIKTRFVGLARDIDPAYTHATSEAFIKGRWVSSDATYDIELLSPEGNRIGYGEALASKSFLIQRGVTGVSGKDLDNPYFTDIEFSSYLNFGSIYPGPGDTDSPLRYPEGWNGAVKNNRGEWIRGEESSSQIILKEAYEIYSCRITIGSVTLN